MPLPPAPRDLDGPWRDSKSSLGPIDPEAVARAADILRDRTMSFEEEEPIRGRSIILAIMGLTAILATLVVVFRRPVKLFLGL